MMNLKYIPTFFWIEFKKKFYKLIISTKYNINYLFSYLITKKFSFFFSNKIHKIESLFAFDLDLGDLKKKQ